MKILSFHDLRSSKGIPYSKSHLWRLERAGRFPKRVQLGERCVVWVEAEIEAWLKDKCENNRLSTNGRLKGNRCVAAGNVMATF